MGYIYLTISYNKNHGDYNELTMIPIVYINVRHKLTTNTLISFTLQLHIM